MNFDDLKYTEGVEKVEILFGLKFDFEICFWMKFLVYLPY